MGYGTSLGTSHEDELSYVMDPMTPKELSDRKEINANETSGDFQSRFGAIDIRPLAASTMPPEASRKLTDALKQSRGTNVPAEGSETKLTGVGGIDPEGLLKQPAPRDSSKDIYVNPWVTITPEDIERGTNVALSVGAGIMAGVKSAAMGSKLADLGRAQVLEDYGMRHPDEIFQKTGFFRGAEGKWRYEIDDSKASFDRGWFEDARVSKAGERTSVLTKILDHPELYKAYPQLQDIRVIRDPLYPATGAEWASQAKTIRMGTEAAKNQGTLMHEVQHAIQDIEGFAKGGAPGKAEVDYSLRYTKAVEDLIPESEELIKKINTKGLTEEEFARSKYLTAVFKKYVEYKKAGNDQAALYYLRLAGEAEARNVETRLLLTEKERRMFHPESTEDVQRHIQIPVDEAVTTSAYGILDPKTGLLIKSEPKEPK